MILCWRNETCPVGGIFVQKKVWITASIALALAGAGAVVTSNLAGVSPAAIVYAAENWYNQPVYSERSNAVIDTRGVKGIENNQYGYGDSNPGTYTVTAGTNIGAKWRTAFFLHAGDIVSNNNPSGKNQTYFGNGAPQGVTMDKAGNMYIAISRRNSNWATSGYLYQGYIMRLDPFAIDTLIKNPKLLRTNPQSLIKANHVRFSDVDGAFASGSLAYDPATDTVKFFVAYSRTDSALMATHPIQLATVNAQSLQRTGTVKFDLYDSVLKRYEAQPNTLAFDNNGNFYSVGAASLNTSNGSAYITLRGVPTGGGHYSVSQLGMSIKPILANQLQGISIDNDRLYINSNAAYLSIDLNNFAKNANNPSMAASANNWMNVEVNRISANREAENVVAHDGVKYMMLTSPSEVLMNGDRTGGGSTTPVQPAKKTLYISAPGGVNAFVQPGSGATSRHFAFGSHWIYTDVKTVNGATYYQIGTNLWIKDVDMSFTKPGAVVRNGIVQAYAANNGGIALWSDYQSPRRPSKIIKSGSKWKYSMTAQYDGTTWYKVGTNAWLDGNWARVIK